MQFPQDLLPGDICLYATRDLLDEAIEIASGDDLAHIEIYAGNGQSWASRNGVGIKLYPFRPDGLKRVRRPLTTFNFLSVQNWFENGIDGLPYGWSDIAANLLPNDVGLATVDLAKCGGADCSHFAAAVMQVGGCPQFNLRFPKNKIKPRDFELCLESSEVWRG